MSERKQRREQIIRVRVNDTEYNKFHEYSKKLGYRSVSDFIRSLVNSGAIEEHFLNTYDSADEKIIFDNE